MLSEESVDSLGISNDSLPAAEGQFNPLFEVLLANVNFETGQAGEGPVIGFVAIKDTAKVSSYLNRREVRELLTPEMRANQDSILLGGKFTRGGQYLYALSCHQNKS